MDCYIFKLLLLTVFCICSVPHIESTSTTVAQPSIADTTTSDSTTTTSDTQSSTTATVATTGSTASSTTETVPTTQSTTSSDSTTQSTSTDNPTSSTTTEDETTTTTHVDTTTGQSSTESSTTEPTTFTSTAPNPDTSQSTGITTTGTASVTTTSIPSASESTSNMPSSCPAGYFGETCAFLCMCANISEPCDSVTGYCKSGCPSGRQGPGCNMSNGGEAPAVVMLAILFTMAMLFALVLLAMFLRLKKQQIYASSAESHAYDFPEMEMQYDGIERIRETEIQVLMDPLGEGRFGDILPGKIQRGKRRVDVAFKTLKDGATEEERKGLLAQLHLYSQLEPQANVIQFFGLCTVADQMYAAFEYAANGNLRNFLRRSSMPESDVTTSFQINRNETLLINFCLEIAQGMQYLVSKKVVHRELMARHILVDKHNTCKVAGLSPTPRKEKNHPVRWMAPESLENGIFNKESDVWSFGVLIWEVMSLGGQPYPDVSTKDLPNLISGTYRMPPPDDCSLEIYDVMKSCWEEAPEQRPTFENLIKNLRSAMEAVEDEISITMDDDYVELE